jgi:catechol 2,3-dioxygenase-like lactoylglutathione lyase family enzyme
MLLNIDHLSLAVRDLKSAVAQYTVLLGHEPSWRGTDGVEQARFQLDNLALELVAPGPGVVGNRIQAHIDNHGDSIWAIAFATADIAKTQHVLERRGIASTPAESKSQHGCMTSELARDATQGVTIFLVERKPDAMPPSSTTTCDANAAISGLDHIVIATPNPERAAALYGARLGLEMKLDRSNPEWGSRLMFFKCGDLIVEVAHDLKKGVSDAPDRAWGLSWRAPDIAAARERLMQAGVNVSEVRTGRKPGTQVFTARDHTASVPTIVIGRL